MRLFNFVGRALKTAKTGFGSPTLPSGMIEAASSRRETTSTEGSSQNPAGCRVRFVATMRSAVSYCALPVE